jgi:hypothetical protein
MNRTIILSLALLAMTACKKDDDKGSSAATGKASASGSASASASGSASASAAPAGGAVKTTPKDLFAEFGEKSGVDPMTLLDKYKDGATFTGAITTGPGDMAPTSAIMDVDGKNHIMMDFTDEASIKGMKAGDTITATCQIGGEMDTMMQVSDCVLVK